MSKVKIGLTGVGLNTYWGQFDGLLNRLEGYQSKIKNKMESGGNATVIDVGLVDDVEKAIKAAATMKSHDVELLFIFISTYALSSTIIPFMNKLNVPVIMLNLQPLPEMDFDKINGMSDRGAMTGEWLANCNACSVPEFSAIFNRAGTKYDIVSGYLDDNEAWDEIFEWIKAAQVNAGMKINKMGLLGGYYNGMVDVYTDLALQTTVFGTHIEILEMCELDALRKTVTKDDIAQKVKEFNQTFNVESTCSDSEIDRAAHTSVALDKLVAKYNLGSLAYYYKAHDGNEYENIITSIIAGNTLLTGRDIPVAGEYEVKNVQAMKILSLMGAGGSFAEFYTIDYKNDVVMLGHDGPAHFMMSESKVSLVPLSVYHGKPGNGLSIQMSVKHSPVTVLSVVEGNDGISLLLAEGESVAGPILNTGNTNSRYKFSVTAKQFVDKWSKAGPSHHCAIGMGHVSGIIKKYAFIANIPVTEIK